MNRKEKEVRRHQEDMALNRGLCWAGGALVLEFLLLMLKRYYINPRVDDTSLHIFIALDKVLRVIRVAGPVILVLAVVWLVMSIKKNKPVTLPVVIGLAGLVLGVCAHITLSFQGDGLRMLFLMVPILAALALVYYLYQKEFFLSALAGGLGELCLWFIRYRGGLTAESALALVGVAGVLVFTVLLMKNGGMLPGGREVRFVTKGASYVPIFISEAAGLAAPILAVLLGTTAAFYLIILVLAWLFVLLVYYTVKLM